MNRNSLASAPDFSARNSSTRRLFLTLILALIAACSCLTTATALEAQISPESDALLHRMYASPDFEVKYFGPARWLDDGSFYTTVAPSAAVKDAQDIVRVETATGKHEILVSAVPTNSSRRKIPARDGKFSRCPATNPKSSSTPIPRKSGAATRAAIIGSSTCAPNPCANSAAPVLRHRH